MFDYSNSIHQVIADIAARVPEFHHLQPDHIWTAIAQSRTAGVRGTYASVLPLRFKHGAREITHRGVWYYRPPLFAGEQEILYVITFYLPRFCNLSFEQKLKTIFHELFHISPEFNGDLRRFYGRNYAHGASRKQYDEQLKPFIQSYLSTRLASDTLLDFLTHNFESLMKEKGRIVGRRAVPPKCRPGKEVGLTPSLNSVRLSTGVR